MPTHEDNASPPNWLVTTYKQKDGPGADVPMGTCTLPELIAWWRQHTPAWVKVLTDPTVNFDAFKESQTLTTMNAAFSGSRARDHIAESLIQRNPFVLLDVDDEQSKGRRPVPAAMAATHRLCLDLAADTQHVVLAAPSFRGYGFRVLILVDAWSTPEEYKAAWHTASQRMNGWCVKKGIAQPFFDEYGDQRLTGTYVDVNAKDWNRGTFPCLIKADTPLNMAAVPMSWVMPEPPRPPRLASTSDRFDGWSLARGSHTVMSLPQSYADNRDDWLIVLCAIKAEYGEDGVGIAREFSQRSHKYGSDTAFDRDWRSLKPEVVGGRTGKSLTWFAQKYNIVWAANDSTPTVNHKLLQQVPTPNVAPVAQNSPVLESNPVVPTEDTEDADTPDIYDYVRCHSNDEWMLLFECEPKLEELYQSAVDAGVSPTGLLDVVTATIGQCLPATPLVPDIDAMNLYRPKQEQKITHIAPFVPGDKGQPIVGYLAVIGDPGKGKTRTVHHGAPYLDVLDVNNPPSGQAIPKRILSACDNVPFPEEIEAQREDSKVTPKELAAQIKKHTRELVLRKPYVAISIDEASVLDGHAAGKHGKGLVGVLSSLYFGNAMLAAQTAATDEANRPAPKNQMVSVSAVVNVQPGTARVLAEDDTGLAARFMWSAPMGWEHVQPGRVPDRLMRRVKRWIDKYEPIHEEPYEIAIDDDVWGEIHAAGALLDLKNEERHKDGAAVYSASVSHFVELCGRDAFDWWLKHNSPHTVIKVVRQAAAIATIGCRAEITAADMRAARCRVALSDGNRDGYRQYLELVKEEEGVTEQTLRLQSTRAATAGIDNEHNTVTVSIVNSVIRLLSSKPELTVATKTDINRHFGGNHKKRWQKVGVTLDEALVKACENGLLVKVDGGYRLPTKQEVANRPHTTA